MIFIPFRRALIAGAALFALGACAPNGGLATDRVSESAVAKTENGYAVAYKGDTLYSVSQRFHVPLTDLAATNNMSVSGPLHEGELVRLPEGAASAAPPPEPEGYGASSGAPMNEPATAPNIAVDSQPLDSGPQYQLQQMGPSGQPVVPTGAATPNGAGGMVQPVLAPAGPHAALEGVAPASPTTGAATPNTQSSATVAAVAASPAAVAGTAYAAAGPEAAINFHWPVTGHVLSGFGKKPDGTSNEGIDIQVPRGTPVSASAPGVVLYTGDTLKDFGNLVLIRHANGWITAYAHLDHVLVDKDAVVAAGDQIGTVGTSGGIKVPQLHFEIREGDHAVDPRKLLQQGSTAE